MSNRVVPCPAGVAEFGDVDDLTVFADDFLPHVLRLDGVLVLHDDLAARIDYGDCCAPAQYTHAGQLDARPGTEHVALQDLADRAPREKHPKHVLVYATPGGDVRSSSGAGASRNATLALAHRATG